MTDLSKIEIYDDSDSDSDKKTLLASLSNVPLVPSVNAIINILGIDWIVDKIYWSVDNSADPWPSTLRAILYCSPAGEP